MPPTDSLAPCRQDVSGAAPAALEGRCGASRPLEAGSTPPVGVKGRGPRPLTLGYDDQAPSYEPALDLTHRTVYRRGMVPGTLSCCEDAPAQP
jgi:hypothetical protein